MKLQNQFSSACKNRSGVQQLRCDIHRTMRGVLMRDIRGENAKADEILYNSARQ